MLLNHFRDSLEGSKVNLLAADDERGACQSGETALGL
jgi:hypothetical protein